MRKHNNIKRKYFIIVGVILFFFILIYLSINKMDDWKIRNMFQDIGIKIESFLLPKVSVDYKEVITGINQELEMENQELKQMLGLRIDRYQFIHADVVKRNIDWYQEIIINKGQKDGIQVDMAVVSNHGLIGKIVETTNYSSTVKLLSANSKDMKVSVDIRTENQIFRGIIDQYLESDSTIQVNNIHKNSEIKVGDSVYTNGLGGVYPTSVYIGKVVEITYDTLGLNKVVKVKPDFSYDTLRYVSVIDRRSLE